MEGVQTENLPQVPAEVREQARLAGGGWLDEVVGSRDLTAPVPVNAIKRSWRLDATGSLTGEYVRNPRFGQRQVRCPYH